MLHVMTGRQSIVPSSAAVGIGVAPLAITNWLIGELKPKTEQSYVVPRAFSEQIEKPYEGLLGRLGGFDTSISY